MNAFLAGSSITWQTLLRGMEEENSWACYQPSANANHLKSSLQFYSFYFGHGRRNGCKIQASGWMKMWVSDKTSSIQATCAASKTIKFAASWVDCWCRIRRWVWWNILGITQVSQVSCRGPVELAAAFQFGNWLFSPAGVGVLTVHILFCWDWCSWTSWTDAHIAP